MPVVDDRLARRTTNGQAIAEGRATSTTLKRDRTSTAPGSIRLRRPQDVAIAAKVRSGYLGPVVPRLPGNTQHTALVQLAVDLLRQTRLDRKTTLDRGEIASLVLIIIRSKPVALAVHRDPKFRFGHPNLPGKPVELALRLFPGQTRPSQRATTIHRGNLKETLKTALLINIPKNNHAPVTTLRPIFDKDRSATLDERLLRIQKNRFLRPQTKIPARFKHRPETLVLGIALSITLSISIPLACHDLSSFVATVRSVRSLGK